MSGLCNILMCIRGQSNGDSVHKDNDVVFQPEIVKEMNFKIEGAIRISPNKQSNKEKSEDEINDTIQSPYFITFNSEDFNNTSPKSRYLLSSIKHSEFTFNDKHTLRKKTDEENESINTKVSTRTFSKILNYYQIKISDVEGELFWNKEICIGINDTILFGIRGKSFRAMKQSNFQIQGDNNTQTIFLNCNPISNDNILAFLLYYDYEKSGHILRLQNRNSFLYSQISHLQPLFLPFFRKTYVMLNNVILSLYPYFEKGKFIQAEVFIEKENSEIYTFSPSDCPITIGRGQCKINLPLKSISKIHCSITFDKDGGFCIIDGFENKKSTNGTWCLIDEELEIDSLKILKFSNKIFKVEPVPNLYIN